MRKHSKRTIRRLFFICSIAFVLMPDSLASQVSLTIEECYGLTKENFPLVKQMALIEKTKEYSLANASMGYLPQINISGQATYQSDVTSFPISIPNISVPKISKDQYRLYGEVNQSLTDAYAIKQQKDILKANAEVENQKLEVELYKLKERVNQLYFGILLIDAQIVQTELLKKDIQNGMDRTNAAIANGVALKSNLDLLKAELLKANQKTTELQSNRAGYSSMLSLFIGKPIDEKTKLQSPQINAVSSLIKRPELTLFDLQQQTASLQNKVAVAKVVPRIGVFFQGGVGRPALNMLDNKLAGYYLTGLRMNWNISAFYTFRKDKLLVNLSQNSVDVQRELFLFNTNLQLSQQSSELNKFTELLKSDNEIISLRENIKNNAGKQLEYGTITTIDYLTFVNAADQAKQNLALHQIQALMAQYNYQTTTGN